MKVSKAIKKAYDHYDQKGFNKEDWSRLDRSDLYRVALLYMVEDLTRVISLSLRSASSTRAK
jgi:hypothetical protein